ncbi:hypothetical protein [Frankia sp. AiPa1]|uniref:hypothetical protein n=1 Tax=Frankia sp. AiPa1 TaxID=573492 RepID=UPI0035A8E3AF
MATTTSRSSPPGWITDVRPAAGVPNAARPARGRRRPGGPSSSRRDHCDTVARRHSSGPYDQGCPGLAVQGRRQARPELPGHTPGVTPPANGGTHHLLRKAVHNDVGTTGTVRWKSNVEKIDELIIDGNGHRWGGHR